LEVGTEPKFVSEHEEVLSEVHVRYEPPLYETEAAAERLADAIYCVKLALTPRPDVLMVREHELPLVESHPLQPEK
jgi:hypothetical protein